MHEVTSLHDTSRVIRQTPRWLTLAALVALIVGAPMLAGRTLDAQAIHGVALDSVSGEPLAGAVVSLLDSTADVVSAVRTSNRGRFELRLHGAGYYALDVRAIGFQPHTSTWISLGSGESVDVTVRVVRSAPLLSRVTVEAEREDIGERSFMGMKLKTMSARVITPSEINAALGGARDYVEIMQSSLPAGFAVKYLDARLNKRCVVNTRNGKCAAVFVDGVRMSDAEQAMDAALPAQIDHVVIVRAIEAGTLFGGDADAGAILIFRKGNAGGAVSRK